jgi:DNA-binding transcriptional LysR family regulator
MNGFRDRPAGTLRLNVPVSATRLVSPAIVSPLLTAYLEIRMEISADDSFVTSWRRVEMRASVMTSVWSRI